MSHRLKPAPTSSSSSSSTIQESILSLKALVPALTHHRSSSPSASWCMMSLRDKTFLENSGRREKWMISLCEDLQFRNLVRVFCRSLSVCLSCSVDFRLPSPPLGAYPCGTYIPCRLLGWTSQPQSTLPTYPPTAKRCPQNFTKRHSSASLSHIITDSKLLYQQQQHHHHLHLSPFNPFFNQTSVCNGLNFFCLPACLPHVTQLNFQARPSASSYHTSCLKFASTKTFSRIRGNRSESHCAKKICN